MFAEQKEKTHKGGVAWPFSIRFFHWCLVILVALTFITSLEDQWLTQHMLFGFAASVFCLWRLYYGFIGPFHTQFRNFIVSPKKLLHYLKKLSSFDPPEVTGHNPPHGWMILGFITILIVEFLLGLAVFWGEENNGLYSAFLQFRAGEMIKEVHEGLGALFLGMIAIHLCGVLFDSWFHKRNLVKGMVFGENRRSASPKETSRPRLSFAGNAIFVVSFILGTTLFFSTVYAKKAVADLSQGGAGWEIWKEECAACHELFHPSLLPDVVWKNMMTDLASHFGDDASLEEEEVQQISRFLTRFSAERSNTEAAYKINRSIGNRPSILRITESPYWIKKHNHLERSVYERKEIRSKTACSSCHQDALSGEYEDGNIQIPNAS